MIFYEKKGCSLNAAIFPKINIEKNCYAFLEIFQYRKYRNFFIRSIFVFYIITSKKSKLYLITYITK